jgi:hypothetical protein
VVVILFYFVVSMSWAHISQIGLALLFCLLGIVCAFGTRRHFLIIEKKAQHIKNVRELVL